MYSQVTTDSSDVQPIGKVEEVPEDDLDDERDEHHAEQAGDDVFCASPHPVDGRGNGQRHGGVLRSSRTCWLPARRADRVIATAVSARRKRGPLLRPARSITTSAR